jgi:hypothetical protein
MFVCIGTAGKISRLAEVCSPQDGNGAKAQTRHSVHHGAGSDSTSMSADSPNSRHSQLTQHSTVSNTHNVSMFFVLFILEQFGFYSGISENIYGRRTIPGPTSSTFLHKLDKRFINFSKCLLILAQELPGFGFSV